MAAAIDEHPTPIAKGPSPRVTGGLVLLTAGLCAAAVAIALSNENLDLRIGAAAVSVIAIAVPVAVGLHLLRRGVGRRFAWLLIGMGLAWALTTPALSDSALPYTAGRLAGWWVQALIICLLLAFPTGRLQSATSRRVAAAAIGVVAVVYIPSSIFVAEFPRPSPWSPCTSDCPENAFLLVELGPGPTEALEIARELIASLIFIATAVVLASRFRGARALTRSLWMPALNVAVASLLLLVGIFAVRRSSAESLTAEVVALAGALAVPLLAVGFLIGLVRFDVRTGRALAAVNSRLHLPENLVELKRLLADSLGDPGLRLYVSDAPGSRNWRDVRGVPAAPPGETDTAIVSITRPRGSIPAVLLVCDRALATSSGVLRAIGACVQEWLERQRLSSALRSSLREVAASRARLAAAADAERRRIERDLHDGAQQRLIALRVRLELAGELMDSDPAAARAALRDLGPSVDEVIDEVRSLSHGIYPSLLTDAGPAEALRAAGAEAVVAVDVDSDGLRRHPAEIESAVYFCCLEALQNAVKHAGAANVRIALAEDDGELIFEVADDGQGLPPGGIARAGRGLLNVRDRVEAVGGTVEISSPANGGVVVRGTIPLD